VGMPSVRCKDAEMGGQGEEGGNHVEVSKRVEGSGGRLEQMRGRVGEGRGEPMSPWPGDEGR
jgi:hypothetical protein